MSNTFKSSITLNICLMLFACGNSENGSSSEEDQQVNDKDKIIDLSLYYFPESSKKITYTTYECDTTCSELGEYSVDWTIDYSTASFIGFYDFDTEDFTSDYTLEEVLGDWYIVADGDFYERFQFVSTGEDSIPNDTLESPLLGPFKTLTISIGDLSISYENVIVELAISKVITEEEPEKLQVSYYSQQDGLLAYLVYWDCPMGMDLSPSTDFQSLCADETMSAELNLAAGTLN